MKTTNAKEILKQLQQSSVVFFFPGESGTFIIGLLRLLTSKQDFRISSTGEAFDTTSSTVRKHHWIDKKCEEKLHEWHNYGPFWFKNVKNFIYINSMKEDLLQISSMYIAKKLLNNEAPTPRIPINISLKPNNAENIQKLYVMAHDHSLYLEKDLEVRKRILKKTKLSNRIRLNYREIFSKPEEILKILSQATGEKINKDVINKYDEYLKLNQKLANDYFPYLDIYTGKLNSTEVSKYDLII